MKVEAYIEEKKIKPALAAGYRAAVRSRLRADESADIPKAELDRVWKEFAGEPRKHPLHERPSKKSQASGGSDAGGGGSNPTGGGPDAGSEDPSKSGADSKDDPKSKKK